MRSHLNDPRGGLERRWTNAARDPGVRAVVVLVVLAVVGFVTMALGWRGAARTVYVPLQSPWLMSGGLGGLAVVGMALGSWSIHIGRRQDAEHRRAMEVLTREAVELIEKSRPFPRTGTRGSRHSEGRVCRTTR